MNQNMFNFAVGVAGAAIGYAFGAWSQLLNFFMLVIVIDYVTGIAASIKEKKGLNSNFGFWGIAKKGLMLVVVMLAHRADLLLGTEVAMTGAIYFYVANELISITENYGRLGLPLPDRVKRLIQVLRDKGGGGE